MALGVPSSGAFGTPAGPRPRTQPTGGLRTPTTPTGGMARMPAGWNRGMGAIRPDRFGASPGSPARQPQGQPQGRALGFQRGRAFTSQPFGLQPRQRYAPPVPPFQPMQPNDFSAMQRPPIPQPQHFGPLPPPGAMPNMPLSLESLGLPRPRGRYGR